jgi:hypothetical protein
MLQQHGPHLDQGLISAVYGNYTDPKEIRRFQSLFWKHMFMLQNQVADPEFNHSLRQSFSFSFNQFKLYSSFKQSWWIPDENYVSYWDPIYGICIKFNSGQMQNNKPMYLIEQTEPGKTYGFHATFFIDVFTNQTFNIMDLLYTYTFGIKLSIDDQDSIPLYRDKMIPIQPGVCTNIALRKTISSRQPFPHSSCQDLTDFHSVLYDKFINLNKTYSQEVCFQLCKQQKVIAACNCSVVDFPNLDHYPNCKTWDQVTCFVELNLNLNGCDESCPLECKTIFYETTTATDLYPSYISYEMIRTDQSVVEAFARKNKSKQNITYSDITSSVACLYVYFDQISDTLIEESPKMTVVKIILILCLSIKTIIGNSS